MVWRMSTGNSCLLSIPKQELENVRSMLEQVFEEEEKVDHNILHG